MRITYATAAIIFAILLVFIAAALWGPTYIYREKPETKGGFALRERYGPPPGSWRAMSHQEIDDDRGWAGNLHPEYAGNTASSVSHMIMLSA